jgi:type 1 fimbria pilin
MAQRAFYLCRIKSTRLSKQKRLQISMLERELSMSLSPRKQSCLTAPSKWLTCSFLLIAANILLPNSAQAAQIGCSVLRDTPGFPGYVNVTSPVTYSVAAPATINVSDATPVGTVLSSATAFPSQSGTYATCMGTAGSTYNYTIGGTVQRFTGSTGISNVYATNIPGIGIRITYLTAFSSTGYLSYTATNSSTVGDGGAGTGGEVINTTFSVKIEWIKTSTIVGNGAITPGQVGVGQFNGTTVANIVLAGSTNIVAPSGPTCAINASSTQTVNLGDHAAASFTGVGSMTPPTGFNINFDCSGGTSGMSRSVYLTMTDATVSSNRTDILNLAANATAKGVGIRIYRDAGATAVKFGAESNNVGNPNQWLTGNVATGTPKFTVPLQARLIQTGPVQQGTVSAVATVTAAYD